MSGKTGKGKKNLWFRSYVTVLDADDKTRTLTDKQFRQWHLLLALYRKNEGVMPDEGAIARALLIPARKVADALRGLKDAGLFELVALGDWAPHDWDEHQMESDSSTERVREFRVRKAERKRNMEREGNVSDPTPRNVSETVLPVSPSSFPPDPPNTTPSESRGQNSEAISESGEKGPKAVTPPQKRTPVNPPPVPRNGFASTGALVGRNLPGLLGERYTNDELDAAVGMLNQFREVNQCHWPAPDAGLCHTLLDACGYDPDGLFGFLKHVGKRKPGNGWGWLVTLAREQAVGRAM